MIDLTGQTFNRLTVIGTAANRRIPSGRNLRYWKCRCECGAFVEVITNSLRCGMTLSCGCLQVERSAKANTTHGMSRNSEYQSWSQMIERCYNENNPAYKNYGGRGIIVCDRWRQSFPEFLRDIGLKPSPHHSIDRINNDHGYTLENCRWATPQEQSNNQRSNVHIEFGGSKHTIAQWARITGLPYHTLKRRYRRLRWSVERTLTEPVRRKAISFL